ncbi:hypothetical protein NEAUS04_0613 [Nematocida ausubeli]|uniref:Sugar phosphate transporter domain-containing protein n=1 Tax=Nematocida ausubeli (strain ATCC PRA-371 / ERTm2) TaxID=1913371 RepID=A0A086J2G3_NEMA1|nr:uncharacterized protein NESG_01452 [Nematocida ausubeli]KAI5132616.1 hypothetical protein NEAUS06_0265 [Nematocida ausubeli]KAI5133133.1 hypothetical protein NEAUS07_0426 [Nematocida ausubeli]KAI5147596.1 hypothetical protein NEAUS05_0891 [Nematocida ausubeli]KAI5161609.1 hypothetical protein NEAUS04_0613 [Nematocida ausubeli]KFG26331.1 hypothetical protein NESG_01452 [Nematocida ausubeli]
MAVPMDRMGAVEAAKISSVVFVVMYSTLYMTKTYTQLNTAEQIAVGGISELIKAVTCFIFLYFTEEYESTEYLPGYLVSGILSSLQSVTWMQVSQAFPNLIVLISSQSKIFFVFLMAIVFMRRRYVLLQYFAQLTLLLGIFMPVILKGTSSLNNTIFEYVMLVGLPILSAYTGVVFEMWIAPRLKSRWKSAVNHAATSAFFSFLISAVLFANGHAIRYENVQSVATLSLVKSVDSIVFGYFIIYYTTLVRMLIILAISPVLSILISYQFEEAITPDRIIGVAITFASILLFHLPYYLNRQVSNK